MADLGPFPPPLRCFETVLHGMSLKEDQRGKVR